MGEKRKKKTLRLVSPRAAAREREVQCKPGSTCEHLVFMPLIFCAFSKYPLGITVCRALLLELEGMANTGVKPGSQALTLLDNAAEQGISLWVTRKNGDHGPYTQITPSWAMDTKQTQGKLNCNAILK